MSFQRSEGVVLAILERFERDVVAVAAYGVSAGFSSSTTSTSFTSELGVSKGFSSAQWEVGTNLAFPRLTWPMGRIESLFDLEDARSHVSFSFLAARRDALKLIIRGRGQAQPDRGLAFRRSPWVCKVIGREPGGIS